MKSYSRCLAGATARAVAMPLINYSAVLQAKGETYFERMKKFFPERSSSTQ